MKEKEKEKKKKKEKGRKKKKEKKRRRKEEKKREREKRKRKPALLQDLNACALYSISHFRDSGIYRRGQRPLCFARSSVGNFQFASRRSRNSAVICEKKKTFLPVRSCASSCYSFDLKSKSHDGRSNTLPEGFSANADERTGDRRRDQTGNSCSSGVLNTRKYSRIDRVPSIIISQSASSDAPSAKIPQRPRLPSPL